ncbi:hypothetical protein ACQEU3_34680 [Spirillospora sp. CA-253888]
MDGPELLLDQAAETARRLSGRIFVHTAPQNAPRIAPLLRGKPSGLVLAGARPENVVNETRRALGPGSPLLIDPAAYVRERATSDAPFDLQNDHHRVATVAEHLEVQRESGVSAAITPTRYLTAGDRDSLDAVAEGTTTVGAQDIIAFPLDAGWLSTRHLDDVLHTLREIPHVKAVVLGGLPHVPESVRQVVRAVRHLAEIPETMLFRTDMAAFDFLSRGGLAASIGSSSPLRRTAPPPERPPFPGHRDRSPSVLISDLVAYVRGSVLADLFGGVPAPRCACAVCRGDRITDWARSSRRQSARLHNVAVWTSEWLPNLIDQPNLPARRRYWEGLCQHGVQGHALYNGMLETPQEPFKPSEALLMWAGARPLEEQISVR